MAATPQSAPQPERRGRHASPADDGSTAVTENMSVRPPYQQPQGQPQPQPQPRSRPQAPTADAAMMQSAYAPVARGGPSGLAMKRRNPLAAWLGLPLITLGIYSLVWYYKIHREMAEFDRRRSVPVAGPMLVLIFLSWTFVAPLVSYFNTGNRIANAQRAAGLRPSCSPWIGLLLCFVFGLQVVYYQVELNKIVDVYGVPEGTEIALRG